MDQQYEEYRSIVYTALEEIIVEFELPAMELTDDTQLIGMLGLNSIDIMHLLSIIDMRLSKHLPFDNMVLKNGDYVTDFTIKDIVDFIAENIAAGSNEPKSIF